MPLRLEEGEEALADFSRRAHLAIVAAAIRQGRVPRELGGGGLVRRDRRRLGLGDGIRHGPRARPRLCLGTRLRRRAIRVHRRPSRLPRSSRRSASRRWAASFAAAVASPKLFDLRNWEKPWVIPAAKLDTFSTGVVIAVEIARTAVSALSAIETALSVTVSALSSW